MANATEQSSIYWLIEELEKWELGKSIYYSKAAIINHARRLHKKEIEKTYLDAQFKWDGGKTFQEYYQETF
jgi:hypothetical protein